jgi:O-acetyl-ADP-ribose deacetylase (regulator of RNase III)
MKPSFSDGGSAMRVTAGNNAKFCHVFGDATYPVGKGNKIIAHLCNDIGTWDAGFALAISKRWEQAKTEYRKERATRSLTLGAVSLIQVEKSIWIASMIARRGVRALAGTPPIRYIALRQCLGTVAIRAEELQASVHMPRIGCGLSGGRWELIEPLIHRELGQANVFVYNIPV